LLYIACLLVLLPSALARAEGDLNGDGRTDRSDLELLIGALGSADPAFDLDKDGRVGLEDFFRLADQIAEQSPADAAGQAPASATLAADSTRADSAVAVLGALPDSARADSLAVPPPLAPPDTTAGAAPVDSASLDAGAAPDTVLTKAGVPEGPGAQTHPDSTASILAKGEVAALADSLSPDSKPAPENAASSASGATGPALPANMPPLQSPMAAADRDNASGSMQPGQEPPTANPALFPPSGAAADSAAQVVFPVPYSIRAHADSTVIWFPDYRLVIKNGNPFGIVDLRLTGQPVNPVHWSWPVADWEWFWYDDPRAKNGRAAAKLIDPPWAPPAIERMADQVVLRFQRPNVLQRGIELQVTYYLRADRPEFDIEYAIINGTDQHLDEPYVMLGFPGFTNHYWISRVADAHQVRPAHGTHPNFIAESLADGREEYLLLRHDLDPAHWRRTLRGAVSFAVASRTYTLTSTFVPGAMLEHVYSAHTNKPWYLTSHLYVFLRDLRPGQQHRLTIHYSLSAD
jgi:hypothetical protein